MAYGSKEREVGTMQGKHRIGIIRSSGGRPQVWGWGAMVPMESLVLKTDYCLSQNSPAGVKAQVSTLF